MRCNFSLKRALVRKHLSGNPWPPSHAHTCAYHTHTIKTHPPRPAAVSMEQMCRSHSAKSHISTIKCLYNPISHCLSFQFKILMTQCQNFCFKVTLCGFTMETLTFRCSEAGSFLTKFRSFKYLKSHLTLMRSDGGN